MFDSGHGVLALSTTASQFVAQLHCTAARTMQYNTAMHCLQLTVFQHVQRAKTNQYHMLVVM